MGTERAVYLDQWAKTGRKRIPKGFILVSGMVAAILILRDGDEVALVD